jgi:hypothetical protein
MRFQGRILHDDWDLYDTRHAVFQPAGMQPAQLEAGYWQAYRDFYRWGSIWRSAAVQSGLNERLRHLAYSGGWKKFEPAWDWVIRNGRLSRFVPLLEVVLASFGRRSPAALPQEDLALPLLENRG